jgi:hypothetical protein
MSEKHDDRQPHSSEHQPERPTRGEQKSVNLSIEEKGMVVMPAVPVPTNEVDIGNMPGANPSPGEGSGNQSGGSEGSDGAGGESNE